MSFCEVCGSHLRVTKEGLWCPKCEVLRASAPRVSHGRIETEDHAVFVAGESTVEDAKVKQACPRCGNQEAFYHRASSSGEHAGVRQERTVERFRCTKCSYEWINII